jgi:hypothetical protein
VTIGYSDGKVLLIYIRITICILIKYSLSKNVLKGQLDGK